MATRPCRHERGRESRLQIASARRAAPSCSSRQESRARLRATGTAVGWPRRTSRRSCSSCTLANPDPTGKRGAGSGGRGAAPEAVLERDVQAGARDVLDVVCASAPLAGATDNQGDGTWQWSCLYYQAGVRSSPGPTRSRRRWSANGSLGYREAQPRSSIGTGQGDAMDESQEVSVEFTLRRHLRRPGGGTGRQLPPRSGTPPSTTCRRRERAGTAMTSFGGLRARGKSRNRLRRRAG